MAEVTKKETDRVAYADALKKLQEFEIAHKDLTPEEAIEKAKKVSEAEARAIQALSRGRTLDAIDRVLAQHVPAGYVGVLCRNNELDIARYQGLGYEVVLSEDPKKAGATPTPAADRMIRVGDSILMQISEEEHKTLLKVKARRIREKRARTDPRVMARAEAMKSNLPLEEM